VSDPVARTPVRPEPAVAAARTPAPAPPPAPGTGTPAWVGPFAVFMAWLAADQFIPLPNPAREIVRDLVLLAAILGFSRKVLPTRAPHWGTSILLGLAVCALWVAPDTLFPGWRSHWLFQNAITGELKTSIPPAELTPVMLALRTARAALLVPIIEELFWRGWLPRWLQDTRFDRVPLGTYTTFAFWATALLFGAEHGPYWEVGILSGAIYNWWMMRTRSLGDLILAHAVTNAALSAYVIVGERWNFWM
jgi:uncharacterized protein